MTEIESDFNNANNYNQTECYILYVFLPKKFFALVKSCHFPNISYSNLSIFLSVKGHLIHLVCKNAILILPKSVGQRLLLITY